MRDRSTARWRAGASPIASLSPSSPFFCCTKEVILPTISGRAFRICSTRISRRVLARYSVPHLPTKLCAVYKLERMWYEQRERCRYKWRFYWQLHGVSEIKTGRKKDRKKERQEESRKDKLPPRAKGGVLRMTSKKVLLLLPLLCDRLIRFDVSLYMCPRCRYIFFIKMKKWVRRWENMREGGE